MCKINNHFFEFIFNNLIKCNKNTKKMFSLPFEIHCQKKMLHLFLKI